MPSPRQRSYGGRQRYRHSQSTAWGLKTDPSDYSYSKSVDRLKTLLRQTTISPTPQRDIPSPEPYLSSASNPAYPFSSIPTPEQVVPVLQNQSALLVQLEADNSYVKNEVKVLNKKIKELVEENVNLNEELKKRVVDELLVEGIEGPWDTSKFTSRPQIPDVQTVVNDKPLTSIEYSKWQKELDRLKSLHFAKTERLEVQLAHMKDELKGYEKETEDLRSKLRVQEALQVAFGNETVPLASGLCLKCTSNEAVLPATYANQKKAMEKLTGERDELMNRLTSLRSVIEDYKSKEVASYEQIKKSVEMVEQAQLEQTKAHLEKEQVKESLMEMKQRMEDHIEQVSLRLQQEREAARMESQTERNKFTKEIKELTEAMAENQNLLDKTTREKVSLSAELESIKENAHNPNEDTRVTGSMQMTMTTATLERDSAMRELKRLYQEIDQITTDRDYERQRLKSELSDVKRRLDNAEKQLIESKEQCIHYTTQNQGLERDLHLAKISKENIEKNRNDDVRMVQRRADQREIELNDVIQSMENRHAQQISELEDLITSQATIITKLRDECKHMANKLDHSLHKYKTDNQNLKSVNTQLKVQVDRYKERVHGMEEKGIQHGELQHKMRERLRQLDKHAQRSSSQVLELLAKETSLLRDRQLLAREIEFLRGQIMPIPNTTDIDDKLYSVHHNIIDDILDSVKSDEYKLQKMTRTADSEGNTITDEKSLGDKSE